MSSPIGLRSHWRRIILVLAFLMAALGVVSLRTLWAGGMALEAAELAFDRGDLSESIRQARRAASLTLPGAPHVDRGFERLRIIARGAEATGQRALSAAAWEAIRMAAIESAHPWSAERPELAEANENIARLRAEGTRDELQTRRSSRAERQILNKLEGSNRPVRSSGVLLALGLSLSVAGLVWAALRGISADGRTFSRHLALGLGVAAIGVACWTFAVYTA